MAALGNLSSSSSLILLIVFSIYAVVSFAENPEIQALLRFKESLTNNDALNNWNLSTPPCSPTGASAWTGVLCNGESVFGLKLDKMGLSGTIDFESLEDLPALRGLSFMNNEFRGTIPDFRKLSSLKTLYLSNNGFEGDIPGDAFAGMLSLKKLYLSRNQFTGFIPMSLGNLPKLTELNLAENDFTGEMPVFAQNKWAVFNVSINNLEGRIPPSLGKMDENMFSGNPELCGPPLIKTCPLPGSSGAFDSNFSDLSVGTIVGLVIVVVVALAAIAAVFVILRRRGQPTHQLDESCYNSMPRHHKRAHIGGVAAAERSSSPEDAGACTAKKAEQQTTKLSFVQEDGERFDLPDLLKASAEVLGGGVFGSTYKAALVSGSVMVVKRFRQMNNVGREEFHEHMRRLGRLKHPNLLPLVAFFYRKEEKLLVSEFINNFSLAVHLHGSRSRGRKNLDWATRLKVIKGVARGLLYLYNELPSLIAPHGHLKSSNILLNKSFDPVLNDYGLAPIVNPEHAQELMIAYKSPEYKQNRRITKKTDVWSLGILILETLTGKFPENCLQQGKGNDADLVSWVFSAIKEDQWSVFDKDMGGMNSNNRGEMAKLLKIGLSCCENDVEKRWELKEAVERIEEVKEKDGDAEVTVSINSF